jgi:hypothetical protein
MVRLVIPRRLLESDPNLFPAFVRKHLKVETAARVVFQAALADFLLGVNRLRKKIRAIDETSGAVTTSFLFSHGRLTSHIELPDQQRPVRIFGRGALFRSPGIGVILTGEKRRQTLVVEYLAEAFETSTIAKFSETLLEELGL